jgi:hypothetical protein
VLVFEQRRFLRFHNAVNSERTCIYFGKLFKNDVLTPTVDNVSLKKFRSQAPVKSAIAKMIKNSMKQVHFWTRIVIGRSQC